MCVSGARGRRVMRDPWPGELLACATLGFGIIAAVFLIDWRFGLATLVAGQCLGRLGTLIGREDRK